MTPLEKAIRAGCDCDHCNFPGCLEYTGPGGEECRSHRRQSTKSIAAALAYDEATIRAMTRAAFDSHTDGKMWPFILTDVLAALRRHILGEFS